MDRMSTICDPGAERLHTGGLHFYDGSVRLGRMAPGRFHPLAGGGRALRAAPVSFPELLSHARTASSRASISCPRSGAGPGSLATPPGMPDPGWTTSTSCAPRSGTRGSRAAFSQARRGERAIRRSTARTFTSVMVASGQSLNTSSDLLERIAECRWQLLALTGALRRSCGLFAGRAGLSSMTPPPQDAEASAPRRNRAGNRR